MLIEPVLPSVVVLDDLGGPSAHGLERPHSALGIHRPLPVPSRFHYVGTTYGGLSSH